MTHPLAADWTPEESDLAGLSERAKAIQAQLRLLPKPVIVEFAGCPKSGKSTNIDIVHHFFRRMDFKVWAPTEGASKRTPSSLRKDLVAFNAWSLSYALSEMLLSYHNADMPHLVILDRGPFDSLAWMGVLQEQKKLSSEEYEIIRKFALHPQWANLIQRIYLFTCSPEVSLGRENEHKLTERPGLAMNDEMLKQLMEQYEHLAESSSDYPVVTVSTDTSESGSCPGPKNTAFAIASDVLTCFEKNWRERDHERRRSMCFSQFDICLLLRETGARVVLLPAVTAS